MTDSEEKYYVFTVKLVFKKGEEGKSPTIHGPPAYAWDICTNSACKISKSSEVSLSVQTVNRMTTKDLELTLLTMNTDYLSKALVVGYAFVFLEEEHRHCSIEKVGTWTKNICAGYPLQHNQGMIWPISSRGETMPSPLPSGANNHHPNKLEADNSTERLTNELGFFKFVSSLSQGQPTHSVSEKKKASKKTLSYSIIEDFEVGSKSKPRKRNYDSPDEDDDNRQGKKSKRLLKRKKGAQDPKPKRDQYQDWLNHLQSK